MHFLKKVKVVSSVGVDECGRGAPLGMKLGRTGSYIRVWENQFVAYVYFRHQGSNVVSLR